jgi:hypothetical protein
VAKSKSLVGFLTRPAQWSISDEIPDEHYQVRFQGVDMVNDSSEEEAFGVFEVMEVTNLRDPHAAKTIGKAWKVDGMLFDHHVVACDFG